MARTARTIGVVSLVVVLAGGGYAAADAYDLVPGVLTVQPEPEQAAPFPTAPGADLGATGAVVLSGLDPAAPLPTAAGLEPLLASLSADARVGAGLGVVVADALTGEVLAQKDAGAARTPASTAKLVTAVAALTTLGADTTFDTTVVQGEGDTIVLTGGGDMMLAAGQGDPDAVNGRAGLADLAAQTAAHLREAGRSTVTLAVDDSLFTGPATAPGWAASDLSVGYVAPVVPLAVNIAKTTEGEYVPRYADPATEAARVFASRLAEQGITVSTQVSRTATADGTATEPIAVVRSAPVSEVTHYFLDHSDNTITEVVSRMVALKRGQEASFTGATTAVLATVHELGADTTGAVLADASGLADGSRLSPRLLLDLLELVVDPGHPELRTVGTGMPIGGLTGTLDERYVGTAGTGVVRAKTGSLSGVTSLAGTVLDADGRLLLFVVMADQTGTGGQAGPRTRIDSFVDSLAGCGCRG